MRDTILRAAEELFKHYGFSKTTVGDIARACSMSPGNLYRYFRNKQDIGRAVVIGFFEMQQAEMESSLILPGGTAAERLRRLVRCGVAQLVHHMEQDPRILELADFICDDLEGKEALGVHIAWKEAAFAREIRRGMESGDFAGGDPEALGAAVLAATKAYWMPMALAHMGEREEVMRTLDSVLDLLLAGLAARAAPAGGSSPAPLSSAGERG